MSGDELARFRRAWIAQHRDHLVEALAAGLKHLSVAGQRLTTFEDLQAAVCVDGAFVVALPPTLQGGRSADDEYRITLPDPV